LRLAHQALGDLVHLAFQIAITMNRVPHSLASLCSRLSRRHALIALRALVALACVGFAATAARQVWNALQERALAEAAREGDVIRATELLDAGVAVNSRTGAGYGPFSGLTPLMWAADRGHLDCARLFLKRGAEPNARSAEGHSILYYLIWGALPSDRDPMLKLLLEAGLDPNSEAQGAGASPLRLPRDRDDATTITLLVHHGLDPFLREGLPPQSVVERALASGDSVLISAVWRGLSERQRRDPRATALTTRVRELGLDTSEPRPASRP
jgi:hypothetical protein